MYVNLVQYKEFCIKEYLMVIIKSVSLSLFNIDYFKYINLNKVKRINFVV